MTTASFEKKKRKVSKNGMASTGSSFDNLELFLLHLPTTIWYIIFSYAPMFGVIIAFMNYKPKAGVSFITNLFTMTEWNGLKNFSDIFSSSFFPVYMRNTIVYNLIFIILGIVIPVTLALMVNELFSKTLAKVCQTMMFLPYFLSWVVVSYFVYAFLATGSGIFSTISKALNIGDPSNNYYQDVGFWRWFLVFLSQWKGMGYGMVVYLASISGIDAELYEAALIDGASKWKQVKYITLPLLRPIISIMFIMSVGGIFRSDFGLFYQSTRHASALWDVSLTLDVYVFNALLVDSNINFSSAASLLQSVAGCITIIAANMAVKKIDPDAGMF